MLEVLKRLLSPEYLVVSDPGPLGGRWVLYLLLGLLFAGGLAAALWILAGPRRKSQPPGRRAWAWFSLWLCLAGVGTVAGRFLGWPGWSARIWPYCLVALALAGGVAYRFRRVQPPAWLARQLQILAFGPLPAAQRAPGRRASLILAAGLLLHLAGIGLVAGARYGWPLWTAPLLLLALLLPQAPVMLNRFTRGQRVLGLELQGLTPLLAAYGITLLWLAYRWLGVTVRGWQGLAFPDPMTSLFYVDGIVLAALTYTFLCQLHVTVEALKPGRPLPGWLWRLATAALLVVTLAWAATVYLGKRTHGATASDPYAYAQMGVDLAERGTFVHRYALFEEVIPLEIPWAPLQPVGYHIPRNDLGDCPSVWATGASATLAAGYALLGEVGLYITTPLLALLSLAATWALVHEVLHRTPRGVRTLSAALTVALLATSPEHVDRLLVPMADAAAQLFTVLTLFFLLRGARHLASVRPPLRLFRWPVGRSPRHTRHCEERAPLASDEAIPTYVHPRDSFGSSAGPPERPVIANGVKHSTLRHSGIASPPNGGAARNDKSVGSLAACWVLAGLCFAWAYWVRHTQLVLALSAPVAIWAAGWHQRGATGMSPTDTGDRLRQGRGRAILLSLALFGTAALVGALPDIIYRWRWFGGLLATETTELPLMSLQHIGPVAWEMLRAVLVAGEWGYLFPLACYGAYRLVRAKHIRPQALVLGSAFLAVLLVHLTYRSLRLRDLLSLFPLLDLAVAYGAVSMLRRAQSLARDARGARWPLRLGKALLPAAAAGWIVLSLALARWVMVEDLWQPGWASFGYMRAEQRAAFDRLAAVTPPDAIVGASLNAGAVALYAGRDPVRPYDSWTTGEWHIFLEAMDRLGRPVYLLDDGGLMASFIEEQREHCTLEPVTELKVPLFYARGRESGWLYRLSGCTGSAQVHSDGPSLRTTPKGVTTNALVRSDGLSLRTTPRGATTNAQIRSDGLSLRTTPRGATTSAQVRSDGLSLRTTPKGVTTNAQVDSGGFSREGGLSHD